MKKNCAFILILFLVLCLAFCGCDVGKISPWGDKNVENNNSVIIGDDNSKTKTLRIYVYGAVEKEGYYEVAKGETYFAAITQAGLIKDKSVLPSNATSIIDENKPSVVVQYAENGVAHNCYDVNSPFFTLRDPARFDGLSATVINKIADYLETHDKIPNKKVLREVLGNDYQDYHYKLYIAEADYEEID